MITLEKAKRESGWAYMVITQCKPFVRNLRAKLIHGPKHSEVYKCGNRRPHLAITCYCGSSFTAGEKMSFIDAPDQEEIVCARCEEAAVNSGKPTSDELAGRHVHIGGIKAFKMCCGGVSHEGCS